MVTTRWRLRLSWLMLVLATVAAAVAAKKTPAKRSYDTHAYYVIELDPTRLPSGYSTDQVVQALGAEHVEQVGELEHHYLIRAPHDIVNQGEPLWSPSSSLSKRARDRYERVPTSAPVERDLVLERHDLLRRRKNGPASHLLVRDNQRRLTRTAIRSLERQHPRQRVKRDLPVLPPNASASFGIEERAPVYGIIQAARDHFSIADPLWDKQWHLVNGELKDNSINVTGVWDQGIFGSGVNVAIVDDGLDMHSDDLAANFVRAMWRLLVLLEIDFLST